LNLENNTRENNRQMLVLKIRVYQRVGTVQSVLYEIFQYRKYLSFRINLDFPPIVWILL